MVGCRDCIPNIQQKIGKSSVLCSQKGRNDNVTNEKNELIPTRTVNEWRICIDYRLTKCMDYRKLNEATTKDHYTVSFSDQMLVRLTVQEIYTFLKGYSGYKPIVIALEDQEKMKSTCSYGIYPLKHMLCGLCNAPNTF